MCKCLGSFFLRFVDPAQVCVGTPAKHAVVGLPRPGLGQELECLLEHELGLIDVVSFEVGQRKIICGVNVQAGLHVLGDLYFLFLVVDQRSVLRESELDVVFDRFLGIAAELFHPRID